MSSLEPEEDTELRDLVANTLQTCGVLGKIKAQLRSNVYLALDGGESQLKAKSTLSNHVLSNFSKTSEGRLVLSLVREFLTFLKLDCTLSVFEAEAIEGRSLQGRSREELIDKLGLVNERIGERHGSSAFDKVPLLSEVLRLSKVSILKSETPSPTENSHREIQASLATMVSGDSNTQNTQPLATSKSSSNSSSFSSIDHSLPERHHSKGVFSTQSSLGDLPPLGGQLTTNARNTLAPLKKIPSSSSAKSLESNLSRDKKNIGMHDLYADLEMSDKSRNTSKSKTKSSKHDTEEISGSGNTKGEGASKENYGTDIHLSKNTKNVLGSRSNSFSRANSKMSNDPIIGKDDKLDSNDDDIEEDIDNFLDSQASGDIGGSEDDFTKDETVASGEETSMKADYVLDLRR